MRLAIADPPYLGRAEMFYGEQDMATMNFHGSIWQTYKADRHPDAHLWDLPETHKAMVDRLVSEYEGWVIAMVPDSLRHYLQWVPERTRIAVWHNPNVMPTGSHPRRRWEPVLVYVPTGRRHVSAAPTPVGDVLTAGHQQPGVKPHQRFAGRKPAAWTRWVLDMLGYDPDTDTVDDLFPGSGAVGREVAQSVLPV